MICNMFTSTVLFVFSFILSSSGFSGFSSFSSFWLFSHIYWYHSLILFHPVMSFFHGLQRTPPQPKQYVYCTNTETQKPIPWYGSNPNPWRVVFGTFKEWWGNYSTSLKTPCCCFLVKYSKKRDIIERMYADNTAGPEKVLESILKWYSDSHCGKAIVYFSLFLTNYKSTIEYIHTNIYT